MNQLAFESALDSTTVRFHSKKLLASVSGHLAQEGCVLEGFRLVPLGLCPGFKGPLEGI